MIAEPKWTEREPEKIGHCPTVKLRVAPREFAALQRASLLQGIDNEEWARRTILIVTGAVLEGRAEGLFSPSLWKAGLQALDLVVDPKVRTVYD